MQVVDFLPTFKPRVYHDTKATIRIWVAPLFLGQTGGQCHHAPQQPGVVCRDMRHRRDMHFGHHQEVHRCRRLNIVEGKDFFVFINLLRGNLARDDFAKKAVRIVHGGGGEKRNG